MKIRFYLVALAVWVLDHVAKSAARALLSAGGSVEVIPGMLALSYVENTGVAFGLFADVRSPWKPYVLAAMALAAIAVIVLYSLRLPRARALLQAALAITLGGILGNLTDRVAYGYVVDFIDLHAGARLHWPTFNVADSAITIGIALLLFDTLRHPDPGRERAAEE